MASIFYQTLMFLLFCCTWGAAFFAVWVNCADIYKAVCVASILWSTFIFALIEGLNLFKAITATNLIIAWGIFLFCGGGYIFSRKKILRDKINFLKNNAVSLYRDNGTSVKALIIFIAFFMLARTVLALISAPHGTDSNAYHLPRIMFWIQHQSVDYYDTHVVRQLFSPVFAEYINLNVLLITGGDLFVNMLQNFSAYGSIILLYGIIRKLGCGIKWALFGCILALSMNVFCVEVFTADVDLVGTFYLMTVVYLIVEVLYQPKLSIFEFILLGLASGLIYITKTNACAPAAVIIIYVVFVKLFQKNFKIIPLGIISVIFILTIVFPTFYRNYNYFNGDFMAKINVGNIAIGTVSPKYVFLNVIKNLCTLGVERNAVILMEVVKTLGNILKIDINAPEIRWNNSRFTLQYSPDIASAGAHIVAPLFLITSVISFIYLMKRRNKTEGLMFVSIFQMFFMLVLVRWQPWPNRLLLPALVVVIVPIVYYFREITKKFSKDSWKYKACYFLVLDLIFQCGICSIEGLAFHSYLTINSLRYSRYAQHWGILSRNSKMFKVYQNFAIILDEGKYNNIGLEGWEEMYQYPVLAKYVPEGKKIECVRLQGNGREIEPMNPNFSPEIILVEDIELNPEKIYTCNGNDYKCVFKLVDDNNNGAVTHYSAWEKVSEKLEDKK